MNLSERFPKMEVTSPLKKVFSKKLHSMVVETSDAKRMRFLLAVSHCFSPVLPLPFQISRDPIFVPGVWGPYFSAMVPGFWLNEGGQSVTGKLVS